MPWYDRGLLSAADDQDQQLAARGPIQAATDAFGAARDGLASSQAIAGLGRTLSSMWGGTADPTKPDRQLP